MALWLAENWIENVISQKEMFFLLHPAVTVLPVGAYEACCRLIKPGTVIRIPGGVGHWVCDGDRCYYVPL